MPILSWEDIDGDVNATANLEGGTTHDMGQMTAAISFVDQSDGSATAFTSNENIYVGSQGFDSDSSLHLYGTGGDGSAADPTITTTIDFSANSGSGLSDNVSNVSFRINDLDVGNVDDQHRDILTVRAYDANGNEVSVNLTPTSSMTQDGNTVSGNDIHYFPDDQQASLLVEIDGPVSQIVIEYANGDVTDQSVFITDIHYSTLDASTDNIVDGTSGDDVMLVGFVDGDDDTIDGADGDDDTIYGYEGNDTIEGGAGVNTIFGGSGDDTFIGGEGADMFQGGADQDNLDYSNSISAVNVDLGTSSLSGGDAENDTILGGIDGVIGSDFDDVLTGFDLVGTTPEDTFTNELYGRGGDDTLTGLGGADLLDGGHDDDVLYGGAGDDDMFGGDGSDVLIGDAGRDTLFGGRDDDNFFLGTGDQATGGHGDDVFIVDTTDTDGELITIDGSDGGEGENPGDTTNDNYPGADLPAGDVLDLTNLFADGLAVSGDAVTYTSADREDGFVTLRDGTIINFEEIENVIVCFARGTMIVTNTGEKAIEDLAAGDKVLTKDNGLQDIRWIGSRTVPAKGKLAPIMIKAGAMANDRDLMVSPQHRMVVEGWKSELLFGEREVLAAAKHLVNNDTIYVKEGGEVEYFHMLFDAHEIVFANGAASESFHPGEVGMDALVSEAREEVYTLFPELRGNADVYGPAVRSSLKAHEAKVLAQNPEFLI